MSEWRSIESAPKEGIVCKVDLWLRVYASPRSFGWGDEFRVTECWWDAEQGWVHYDGPVKVAALYADYITHWMPLPVPPQRRMPYE